MSLTLVRAIKLSESPNSSPIMGYMGRQKGYLIRPIETIVVSKQQ